MLSYSYINHIDSLSMHMAPVVIVMDRFQVYGQSQGSETRR